MLSELVLDTWEDKCITRLSINQATFNTNIRELTRSICGKNTFDNQEEYLKSRRKLDDMTMAQWLKQIEAINKVLLLLKSGGQLFRIPKWNKQVVLKNLPGQVAVKYIEQGSKKLTLKEKIKDKLKELKEANNLNQKFREATKGSIRKCKTMERRKAKTMARKAAGRKNPRKTEGKEKKKLLMNAVYQSTITNGKIVKIIPVPRSTKGRITGTCGRNTTQNNCT
eukprot:9408325-Ditylum_brightwellii.AAC.1